MADALRSGRSEATRGGSTPLSGTIFINPTYLLHQLQSYSSLI